MSGPTQTCQACGRVEPVRQDGRGFPPDIAKRRLRKRCKEAGCACDPQYRAGVQFWPRDWDDLGGQGMSGETEGQATDYALRRRLALTRCQLVHNLGPEYAAGCCLCQRWADVFRDTPVPPVAEGKG
jgi:hypothetical protein